MTSLRTILVPTDYSVCAETALMHGLHLARAQGARLVLLHVRDRGWTPSPGEARHALFLSAPGGTWDTVAVERDEIDDLEVGDAVLRYARRRGVDLIVMGTHSYCSAERFFHLGTDPRALGQTASHVVREAMGPVMTVRPTPSRAPDLVRRLLVPVGADDPPPEVLRTADRLAAAYDADVDLLHVIDRDAARDAQRVAVEHERLEHLATQLDRSATVQLAAGTPADVIAQRAAQRACQLVVLGVQQRPGLSRPNLGPVAEGVLQHCPCPVLTVKRPLHAARRRVHRRLPGRAVAPR